MGRLPLRTVRTLSIAEIAELWSQEVEGIPLSTIERELRIFLLNLPRLREGAELIESIPDDDALPATAVRLSPEEIAEFCAKQRWPKPRFWFGEEEARGPSFPGRPSIMRAIVQELESRFQAGEQCDTVAAQARELAMWASERFPGEQVPTKRTIENGIRDAFRKLRTAQN